MRASVADEMPSQHIKTRRGQPAGGQNDTAMIAVQRSLQDQKLTWLLTGEVASGSPELEAMLMVGLEYVWAAEELRTGVGDEE